MKRFETISIFHLPWSFEEFTMHAVLIIFLLLLNSVVITKVDPFTEEIWMYTVFSKLNETTINTSTNFSVNVLSFS